MTLKEFENTINYKKTGIIALYSLKKVSYKETVFLPDQESKKYLRFDFLE